MSRTGAQLLTDFSDFIGDNWASVCTSAGASDGTTLVDTLLQRYGRDLIRDGYIRVTQSGSNQYVVRRVSNFTTSTATLAPAFPAQVASSSAYEFHRYDPARKFAALDRARYLAYPQLAVIAFDDTVTGDGQESQFLVPSTIRKGPVQVYEEKYLSPLQGWNPLSHPALDVLTNWTAATLTAAIQARIDQDWLIPKYAAQFCTKLTGAGSYTQAVSAMSGVTAARAAGRKVTFGMWVFTLTATSVRVKITDDSTTTYSSYHTGTGWQFLQVTKTVTNTNATTLTVGYESSTSNTVSFVMNAMMRFGAKIGIPYPTEIPTRGLWRDDTNQEVHLTRRPKQGYQLRFIGRSPLSALGTTASTQVTATMEVDQASQELLFAKAARILFTEAGMSAGDIEKEFPKISAVEKTFAEMAPDWEYNLPYADAVDGWWSD